MYIDVVQNKKYKGDTIDPSSLFELLTEMGFAVGHYKEGLYYLSKEEVEKPEEGYSKYELASTYFAYACNDGHGESCYEAGKIYEEEKVYQEGDIDQYGNTKRDPFLISFLYYEAGAKLGNAKCKYKLGVLYSKGK